MYDKFVKVQSGTTSVQVMSPENNTLLRVPQLLEIVSLLPKENFTLLKCLCQLLGKVHENARKNRMTADNLALIFGPVLFASKEETADQMLNNVRITADILKILILNHDKFSHKPARRFSVRL